MDFVAIDFETANRSMTSACSLGVAVVQNNRITKTKEWLIKPAPFRFDYYNTKVHGITRHNVESCLTFDGLWCEISDCLQDNLLVAHNAPFDMSVLKHLIAHFGLESPDYDYYRGLENGCRKG